jgi:hypothetical protein
MLSLCMLPACESGRTLELRLTPGRSYFLEVSSKQTIRQTLPTGVFQTRESNTFTNRFDVLRVDQAGVHHLRAVIERIAIRAETPSGVAEYDSINPALSGHPSDAVYDALVNEVFEVGIDDRGRVTYVRGGDALIDRVMARATRPGDARRPAGLGRTLKTQFGDEGMTDTLQNAMLAFPEQSLRTGDAWERVVDLTHGFPIHAEHRWTIREWKANAVEIDVAAQFRPIEDGDDPALDELMNGTSPRYRLTGSQAGRLEVDPITGWIRRSSIDQTLAGHINTMLVDPDTEAAAWTPVPIEITGVYVTVGGEVP